ncbi:carbohydrate ABC transporter permease [Paenibacillus sp.]|uniref:carbohydrate ABC transporter permease n=1 Tax=Paenibacillus sp. TaxID=58172 RepID=UPI00281196AC|nr:carbohydrate ABC transporter permease [Paenibacillus sp.]
MSVIQTNKTASSVVPAAWVRRWRGKASSAAFWLGLAWSIVRYLLLIGLAFLILYPLLFKLTNSFMSQQDLIDGTVRFIPREPTLFNYRLAIKYTNYFAGLKNTFGIAVLCGVLQMLVCTFVGYGLARFRFKGRGLVFALVVFTILIPPQTYMISLYLKFSFFDLYGILSAISGGTVRLIDSIWPLAILSLTGFGFKNGLYILIMRQYFKGIPKELEEAAYVDGSGLFRTFGTILLPLSASMMITVLLFSFSWQWTDSFYSSMFFSQIKLLSNSLLVGFEGLMLEGATVGLKSGQPLTSTLTNTMSLLVLAPLIVMYLFAQKYLVEGIEHSGIVG